MILFHDVQRDIPNLEFSPSHVSIGFSQIAFPIVVLLKNDHTDFGQEEQLGLSYRTMILVDVSKHLDILTLEFSKYRRCIFHFYLGVRGYCSSHFFFSEVVVIDAWDGYFVELLSRLVRQLTISFHTLLCMTSHVIRP